MRRLRLAVALWAVLALVGAQRDYLDALAIHTEVEDLRCNSSMNDYKRFYSRVQLGIREKREFQHYLPGGACVGLYPFPAHFTVFLT